jgi:hypothetical protein
MLAVALLYREKCLELVFLYFGVLVLWLYFIGLLDTDIGGSVELLYF